MLRNRYVVLGGILAILIVANIIRYFVADWGLVTVTVDNKPLGQVIKSIERQGWVKIYTNMDLTTPISMYVVKVPVAEALDTLVANIPSAAPPPGQNPPPAGGGSPSRHGGGGGGGNEAEWNLGFFAAPTESAVKQEIVAFETNSAGDDTSIYHYPTPLNMLSSGSDDDDDSGLPSSDPRLQAWPGYQPPPAPQVTPVSGNAGDDAQAPAPAPAAPPAPTTVQDYLQAVAEQTDIWIMSPSAWTPTVPGPPAPNSSVIGAVKSLVSSAHGAVESAIILRAREHHHNHGPGDAGGGDTGWTYMADRVRSAIEGMPPEARAQATASLNDEISFQQQVQAAPPDQRMDMYRKHLAKHHGFNSWRRSPEKRAQMYQRAVSNRQAVRGQ
jgi:hypothetical protein